MRRIRVSSLLPASFRDELERIVFFNPEQELVTAPLVASVHRYGVPTIFEEDGWLRFRVSAVGLLQTLYAFDDSKAPAPLVGVAMFTRETLASVVLIHLAVHEDYTVRGRWSDAWVVSHLVAAIRGACLRTRGIRTLRVLYPHEIRMDLRGLERSRPGDARTLPGNDLVVLGPNASNPLLGHSEGTKRNFPSTSTATASWRTAGWPKPWPNSSPPTGRRSTRSM
jgi:hypothetical protein